MGLSRWRSEAMGVSITALLLCCNAVWADTVVFPLPPENVDPSTVAVTNESPGAWWPRPYHERYRIIVDFDFDGHDDMILSEPISYFGTGGGCWSVYHWTNGTYQAVGDLAAHYAAWSFDKDPETGFLRFWSYWHLSCQTGSIGYNLIEPCKVQEAKALYVSLSEEEGDAAMAMYNAVLRDHGVRYRYERSSTTNGVVSWKSAADRRSQLTSCGARTPH